MAYSLKLTSLLLAFLALLFASLYFSYPLKLNPSDFIAGISDPSNSNLNSILLNSIRIPRTLLATLVGATLAVTGLLLQTLVRNPIASPTILGINSGCILMMVILTTGTIQGLSSLSLSLGAAFGGFLAWVMVMAISYDRRGFNKGKLILAGITVSLLLMSISRVIIIFNDDRAINILSWIAGGFDNTQWHQVINNAVFTVPGLIICFLLANKLNLLSLPDETLKSLGEKLTLLRIIISVLALLMISACVAIVGTLGFVGLLAPHIATYLVGVDNKKRIPITALVGATLVLVSDMISRWIFFPSEIPAGLIIAMIGSPYFLYMAIKKI